MTLYSWLLALIISCIGFPSMVDGFADGFADELTNVVADMTHRLPIEFETSSFP